MNQQKKDKRILFILPKFIGDSVNTLPAIELAQKAYPNHEIYVFASPNIIDVLQHHKKTKLNFIKDKRKTIEKHSLWHCAQELRKYNFEISIVLRTSFREAILSRLSFIPKVIGYDQDFRGLILTKSLKLDENDHYIYRYCRLINELNQNRFENYSLPSLNPTIKYAINCPINLRKVAVSFGGRKGNRQLSFNKSLEMIMICHEKFASHFYFVGAPFEKEAAKELYHALIKRGIPCTNLVGKTNPSELVEIIAQMELMLCTDSGPMHIACACGVPTIAFVGKGTSPWSLVAPKHKHFIGLISQSTSLDAKQIINDINALEFIDALNRLAI